MDVDVSNWSSQNLEGKPLLGKENDFAYCKLTFWSNLDRSNRISSITELKIKCFSHVSVLIGNTFFVYTNENSWLNSFQLRNFTLYLNFSICKQQTIYNNFKFV